MLVRTLVTLALLLPTTTFANMFALTSGTLELSASSDTASLDLSTDNFEYHTDFFVDLFAPLVMTCGHTRQTCLPGDTINAYLSRGGDELRGAFTLDDASYTVAANNYLVYPNQVLIDLRGSTMLPYGDTTQALQIVFPFTYTISVLRSNEETFTASAQGSITLDYLPLETFGWAFDAAIYNFATQQAALPPQHIANPEPGSLVLLSTGAAAWYVKRRRSRM